MIEQQEKKFVELEGVTKKAWPFSIKKNNDTLVILVHGFTGTPYDLWILADFLAINKMDVEVPLLAGHGSSTARLAASNAEDWFKTVEDCLLRNIGKYRKIFFIGYSFGSNLAFSLSVKYQDDVTGVISLGLPIFMRNEKRIRLLLPLAKIFKKTYKKYWLSEEEEENIRDQGRHNHIPINSIINFYDFIDQKTKKEINQVSVPVLVIHSRDDLVSDPYSSEFLFRELSNTKDKHLFILNKDEHNVVDNTRRDFIFSKTLEFIKKH
ncbi:alpha/beta fold hydrolase [Candidatus Nomurabacteria bacterium]|nr:alpha/beta fold hydrolase [Candidatus Nomurabacteria bacterium]